MSKESKSCVGWVLTIGYLAAFVLIEVICGGGNKNYFSLDLNEKGDFLAGMFAPLAFLWLVLGYLQNNKAIALQAEELRNSVDAVNLQTKELKLSVEEMQHANKISHQQLESVESNERHARRDLFLRYAEIQVKELEACAKQVLRYIEGNIYVETFGGGRAGGFTPGHSDVNLMLIEGAEAIFSHTPDNYVGKSGSREKPEIVREYIDKFIDKYNALESLANKYDDEGELEALFGNSSYKGFYDSLRYLKEHYPFKEK